MSDFYSQSVGCLDHLHLCVSSSTNQYEIVTKKFGYSIKLGRRFIPTPSPHG